VVVTEAGQAGLPAAYDLHRGASHPRRAAPGAVTRLPHAD
jgi:hypothetical protein